MAWFNMVLQKSKVKLAPPTYGFKMGMLTLKPGIDNYSCLKIFEKKSLFNKAHNFTHND